jgi:hypothetical protein
MPTSDFEKRRITIWEQMRGIEGELFLLSARAEDLDFENGHRFERLCGERTKLASELLLNLAVNVGQPEEVGTPNAGVIAPPHRRRWSEFGSEEPRPPGHFRWDY